jgi:hypothetical protein
MAAVFRPSEFGFNCNLILVIAFSHELNFEQESEIHGFAKMGAYCLPQNRKDEIILKTSNNIQQNHKIQLYSEREWQRVKIKIV